MAGVGERVEVFTLVVPVARVEISVPHKPVCRGFNDPKVNRCRQFGGGQIQIFPVVVGDLVTVKVVTGDVLGLVIGVVRIVIPNRRPVLGYLEIGGLWGDTTIYIPNCRSISKPLNLIFRS